MRKLPVLFSAMLALVLIAWTSSPLENGEHNPEDTTSKVEMKLETSSVGQSTSWSLTEWCQRPSWLFGLPNIVALMASVFLLAIIATIIAMVINHQHPEPVPNVPAMEKAPPLNGKAVPTTTGTVLIDKTGNELHVHQGAGHSFTIYLGGKTYQGSHDGSWRRITIRFEGQIYTYTDNIGKGSFLCTQAGAPFGNLLKRQAVPA
jgi:hypothetical protein